jgi:2,4-dienoyl-CoA reductase-like NADH-dependent reductase (Old Yellow Enzyme family)
VDHTPGLFSPLRIGRVTVPNRIMQAAHSKVYGRDGHDTARDVAYAERRARGGAGLLVAGNRFVHPTSSMPGFPDGFRDTAVEPGRRLVDAVHEHGTRMFVQLNHQGAQVSPDGPDGPRPVYSSSRLLSPATGVATRAASPADIATFTAGWARSAAIARESGFDGVEVHMAHGYLLHQFLSPLYNSRGDEYGGDLTGRSRFPREVLRAVRAAVGEDYTVGIRIVVDDFLPGGLTAADALDVIDLLRAETRIDFLDLAGGGYHNPHVVFPSAAMPATWLRAEVAGVKARNPDVPVFGVGAAADVEGAAEVVELGIADMVALTRAQIADPDVARKLREGRTDEVVHCIRLNQGCLGRGATGLPMACTVNPVAGREATRSRAAPTPHRQSWVVVGGGPAGLTAAAELAGNGHAVTLLERTGALGGQLPLAATVPGRETLARLVDDMARTVARAGVVVRLGVEGTPELLRALAPHGIVLATGARAPHSGSSLATGGPACSAAAPVLDATTALTDPAAVGPRVAVVDDDGTSYAAGITLALLARGHAVALVTPFETVFPRVQATMDRPHLLQRLHAGEFRATTGVRVDAVTDDGLELTELLPGHRRTVGGFDTVVLATPRESVPLPGGPLPDPAGGVHTAGDCVDPRTIDAAVYEGFEIAFAAGRHGG